MSNIKRRIKKIEDQVGLNQEQVIVEIITFEKEPPPDHYSGPFLIHYKPYNEYAKEVGLPEIDFEELRCKRTSKDD